MPHPLSRPPPLMSLLAIVESPIMNILTLRSVVKDDSNSIQTSNAVKYLNLLIA